MWARSNAGRMCGLRDGKGGRRQAETDDKMNTTGVGSVKGKRSILKVGMHDGLGVNCRAREESCRGRLSI